MSWSCSALIPKGSSETEARAILNAAPPMGNDDCPDEREAAVTQAREAALALIYSEPYGSAECSSFRVSLSGHCNPHGERRAGWSSDFVNISIAQYRE